MDPKFQIKMDENYVFNCVQKFGQKIKSKLQSIEMNTMNSRLKPFSLKVQIASKKYFCDNCSFSTESIHIFGQHLWYDIHNRYGLTLICPHKILTIVKDNEVRNVCSIVHSILESLKLIKDADSTDNITSSIVDDNCHFPINNCHAENLNDVTDKSFFLNTSNSNNFININNNCLYAIKDKLTLDNNNDCNIISKNEETQKSNNKILKTSVNNDNENDKLSRIINKIKLKYGDFNKKSSTNYLGKKVIQHNYFNFSNKLNIFSSKSSTSKLAINEKNITKLSRNRKIVSNDLHLSLCYMSDVPIKHLNKIVNLNDLNINTKFNNKPKIVFDYKKESEPLGTHTINNRAHNLKNNDDADVKTCQNKQKSSKRNLSCNINLNAVYNNSKITNNIHENKKMSNFDMVNKNKIKIPRLLDKITEKQFKCLKTKNIETKISKINNSTILNKNNCLPIEHKAPIFKCQYCIFETTKINFYHHHLLIRHEKEKMDKNRSYKSKSLSINKNELSINLKLGNKYLLFEPNTQNIEANSRTSGNIDQLSNNSNNSIRINKLLPNNISNNCSKCVLLKKLNSMEAFSSIIFQCNYCNFFTLMLREFSYHLRYCTKFSKSNVSIKNSISKALVNIKRLESVEIL